MGVRSKRGDIIRQYCLDYPTVKDYSLAAIVAREHPELYPDKSGAELTESMRVVIRYYRGHSGEDKRTRGSIKETVKPITNDTTNMKLDLKSYRQPLKTFTLPTAQKEILFLSDIHIPYQDNDALEIALNYGLEKKVDTIWLNGDIMDCYAVSAHEKFPNKAQMREEFEITKAFFQRLRKEFPKAQIYFALGNHESRLARYLARKAPELFGMEEFEIPVILKLREEGIHCFPNGTLYKFGKLNVIHGNEFKGGGGVNAARTLFLRAKTNVIAGDKHKTAENTEGDLNGKLVTTWAVGCLCELNPEYMPFAHTTWNLGFAHISMLGKGEFHVRNYRIHNGKIL